MHDRNADIQVPKLNFPFRLHIGGQEARYDEQDSDGEIEGCVEVLLRTVVGERMEVPDYGNRDYAFREGGADLNAIVADIYEWEPRARTALTRTQLEEMVDRVRVALIEEDLHGN